MEMIAEKCLLGYSLEQISAETNLSIEALKNLYRTKGFQNVYAETAHKKALQACDKINSAKNSNVYYALDQDNIFFSLYSLLFGTKTKRERNDR